MKYINKYQSEHHLKPEIDAAALLKRRMAKGGDTALTRDKFPFGVFIHRWVVEQCGVLPALVMADLVYWLYLKGQPNCWRPYSDWSAMLNCSEKSVGRSVDKLRRFGLIETARTKHNNGAWLGTLVFTLGDQFYRGELAVWYRALKRDISPIQAFETPVRPKDYPHQLIPLQLLNQLKHREALVLMRLMGPLAFGCQVATFIDYNALAKLCWVSKHVAIRLIQSLKAKRMIRVSPITLEGYPHAFSVQLGESALSVSGEIQNWAEHRSERFGDVGNLVDPDDHLNFCQEN